MTPLSHKEQKILKKLSTPVEIQDFLDTLVINFEKEGETLMSPRRVLQTRRAHCIEAALLAALALQLKGKPALLLDLKASKHDDDHVVALYRKGRYWGAISKSNHGSLRFRDPVYKTVRELALSYFHEYFENKNGRKTLRSYSKPFNLKRYKTDWVTSPDNLWYIAEDLDNSPHFPIAPQKNLKLLRPADKVELQAGKITEWKRR